MLGAGMATQIHRIPRAEYNPLSLLSKVPNQSDDFDSFIQINIKASAVADAQASSSSDTPITSEPKVFWL